ncbi:MAG: single-stranded DNA-binding protein [Oscillospiraceae bacterium]|jgi:hypothetical protein|nr:single-stranded DNA-binding protein [Oscillospiraceae bacterium]
MNSVMLRGIAAEAAEVNHISHEARFYRLWLDVSRLSGKVDRLRVLLPEEVLGGLNPAAGDGLEVTGQMRTYNNKTGIGGRLIVSALAREITPRNGEPVNRLFVSGTLCRAPSYRKTPLGREICDIMLAVPRSYNRTNYLPLIAWGGAARVCAQMETGQPLFAEGRFQSRAYTKQLGEETVGMTAYEVSVLRLAVSEEELQELATDS